MMRALIDALGANQYQPHESCLAYDRILMTLFAAFDLATMVSYLVIGATLLVHASGIVKVSMPMLRLYGCLFLLCGIHRAAAVLTLFVGVFRLELIVDAAMFGTTVIIAALTVLRVREIASQSAAG